MNRASAVRPSSPDGLMGGAEMSEASDDDDYSTPSEGVSEEASSRNGRSNLPPRQPPRPAALSFARPIRGSRPRDVFWLVFFLAHLGVVAFVSVKLGRNRWHAETTNKTEDFWPKYGMGAGVGSAVAWFWLRVLRWHPNQMIKVAVNAPCTFLALICVFCFWVQEYFWGVAVAIGALLQFLYAMAVMDRLAFTMLMVRKAIGMVERFPSTMWVAYAFMLVLTFWLACWTFGVAGVVAFRETERSQWWILLLLSMSLFWTGAVFCNTVHVTVAGAITSWLSSGRENAPPMPPHPTLQALAHALTTSLGSICYGSLFTAAIRTLRWAIRGLRSRCGRNECMLCCVDVLFHLVETFVRFFNKYGFVTVAMYGKGFNSASRDAWELFQATGMEALIAYDLTGAVLIMGIILGAMVTGTAVGIWCWFVKSEQVVMVGATSMLMGAMLIGITMVVISSTVTAIYVVYAEDPTLIGRVDPEFAAQLAQALHNRLQHRSGKTVGANLTSGLPGPGGETAGLALPL